MDQAHFFAGAFSHYQPPWVHYPGQVSSVPIVRGFAYAMPPTPLLVEEAVQLAYDARE